MGQSRIVLPETVKLPLSDGDWIVVKRRLNHGEQDAAFARRYKVDGLGTQANLLQQTGMAKITAYLLDWSLVDPEGKPLVIRGHSIEESIDKMEAALNAIDEDDFQEILAAITAHETQMAMARAQEKKRRAGVNDGPATSVSPSDAAGASSGSAPST